MGRYATHISLIVCNDVDCVETVDEATTADMLVGHHAGLAVGSRGAQSTMLPQSLLMAQHPSAQQLLLARQDPSALLSSHAGLVGHQGLGSASGLAVLPGLAAQGLHDYQHGLVSQQQAGADVQPGFGQTEANTASSGLQQLQHGNWPTDPHLQQSSQHDTSDRSRRSYLQLLSIVTVSETLGLRTAVLFLFKKKSHLRFLLDDLKNKTKGIKQFY